MFWVLYLIFSGTSHEPLAQFKNAASCHNMLSELEQALKQAEYVNIPLHGQIMRSEAKALSNDELFALAQSLPLEKIDEISAAIEEAYKRDADLKTKALMEEGIQRLETALKNAKESGNQSMANTIQQKISSFRIDPIPAKRASIPSIAREYIDSLPALNNVESKRIAGTSASTTADFTYTCVPIPPSYTITR